ncbi:uncharacterized protein LOC122668209 [Telopea speciosissima]|uniref:uncharacterized protein LOC122668209 n=1 Tax=Telopea speciosissima TaxID=54955 RepID=UPI001CC36753|nr:uncharacterized protein LOC122668209 [Telopea speciosissima]
MAPSNTVVGSDRSSTTKINRIKKVTVPVSVSSSSRLTEFHEGPLSADGSSLGVDDVLSSDKGPMLSEEKHSSFRYKDPVLFSDQRFEEERVGSVVELDVSFKSNALVAKAVMAPSNTVVGSDGSSTTKIKRIKKVPVPVSVSSSSRLTEFHEGPLSADGSSFGVDDALSSDKGPMLSEEKHTVSGTGVMDNIGSQPGPIEVNASIGKRAKEGSPEAMASTKPSIDVNVSHYGMCTRKIMKKRKIMATSSSFSISQASEISKEPRNVDQYTSGAAAILSSDSGRMVSEEKTSMSAVQGIKNVGLQPCPNTTTVLLAKGSVRGSAVAMVSQKVVPDIEVAPNAKKIKKDVGLFSGLSSSRLSEIHEGPVNTNSSVHVADVNSDATKNEFNLDKRSTVSDVMLADDVDSDCSTDGPTTLLESSLVEGSPEAMVEMTGDGNFGSDGTCTNKSIEKTKVTSPSPACLSSQLSESPEKPVGGDSPMHCEDAVSSSDKVLMDSAEKVTVFKTRTAGSIGKQLCPCVVSVSLENSIVKGSPKATNTVSDVLTIESNVTSTCKIKRNRKVQVLEIHERLISGNSSTNSEHPTSNSDNVPSQSEEKSIVSDIGKMSNVASLPYSNDFAVTDEIITLKGSPKGLDSTKSVLNGSDIYVGPLNTDSSIHDLNATTSSEKVLSCSKQKVAVSCIGYGDKFALQPCPNKVSVLLEPISVKGSPKGIDSVIGGSSEGITRHDHPKPIACCSSFVEHPDGAIPGVAMGSYHGCPLQYDILGKECGSGRGREEQTAEVDYILGRENSKDTSVLHPQAQGQLDGVPLDIHTSRLDESPPGMAMEGNASASVYLSLGIKIISDSNGEPMGSVPDRSSKMESPESLSTVPELHILNTEQSLPNISNKKIVRDKINKRYKNTSVKNASALTASNSCTFKPDVNMKPDKKMQSDGFRAEKKCSLKDTTPSAHITNSRTWRRTDDPSAPLAGKRSWSSTSSSLMQSPKKFGKVQSTSYSFRGNSLVRKGAPNSGLPQNSPSLSTTVYWLSTVGKDETNNTTALECKGNNSYSLSCSRAGGANPFESPKTLALPHSSKLQNSTTKSSQDYITHTSNDPLSKGGLETSPDPTNVTEKEDASKHPKTSKKQASLSNNLGIQGILSDSSSQSSKMKGVVYVKHKSNQLVAASNPGIFYPSINVPDKTQALSSSVSSDCNYKRSKNQLIQIVQIPGNQVRQFVAIPDDSSNSEEQRVSTVPSLKCSRSVSKRRPHKVFPKMLQICAWHG